jgi:hypothetical protein
MKSYNIRFEWILIVCTSLLILIILTACVKIQRQTATAELLSMQYEITAADSGKTFTYHVTTRFTVILDASKYPNAELACKPDEVLGTLSNIPALEPPFYAARFETVIPGTCMLSDRDFQVTIQVVPLN